MGTITPVDEYDSTLVAPDNGDDLDAAVIETALQRLGDRAKHLLDATAGLAVWGWSARVSGAGASSGNTGVYVPMVEALSLTSGTKRQAERISGETQLTTADHFGGGTLGNNTWYYVYAYISGGALALQISADPPESGLVWKSGAGGTHRYLFGFRTNGSGVPIPMRMSHGRYHWRFSAISSSHSVASYTATQSYTDLSLAAYVPPHARLARLRVTVYNTDTTASHSIAARVRTNGDTTGYDEVYVPPAADTGAENAGRGAADLAIETDSSQVIEVEIAGTSTGFSVGVYARGFEE